VGRSAKIVIAVTLVVVGVGCGVWAWFLLPQSLDDADKWSSVLAGVVSVVVGVPGLVIGVMALRQPAGSSGSRMAVGNRGVAVGGEVKAPIVTGDHNVVER
jgi:hypothetical protein